MRILTDKEIKKYFGKFDYEEGRKGRIIVDKKWIEKNIVCEELPIIGKIYCHKEVLFTLFRIFYRIENEGLTKEINVDDYKKSGGCWVTRHKCWDSSRGISTHSWGIAIDINVYKNPYGKPPNQHPAVVSIFEKYGYYWGGRFAYTDGMHFEPSEFWQPFKPIILLDKIERWRDGGDI
jgi:hypothetical protein